MRVTVKKMTHSAYSSFIKNQYIKEASLTNRNRIRHTLINVIKPFSAKGSVNDSDPNPILYHGASTSTREIIKAVKLSGTLEIPFSVNNLLIN